MVLVVLTTGNLHAQQLQRKMMASGKNAEMLITESKLRQEVEYLTDSLFKGRETGTRGANEAAFWIARRFAQYNMMPICNGQFSQSFMAGDAVGHNIIGFIPGNRDLGNQLYTIIEAHYDSHGMIDGKLFPGADSNASGVVALTSLAEMFSKMKELGRSYGKNMIFVAMDAREKNSAGANALWEALSKGKLIDPISNKPIAVDKVESLVVLDILGSTESPVHKGRKDYLMMLSDGHFTTDLEDANNTDGLHMDISFSYYGSKNFTSMFHKRIGDQRVFVENGVYCELFTSGITMLTNKVEDNAESLDYHELKKRIFLIFRWFEKIL